MIETTDSQADTDLISLTADMVSTYVSNDPVPVGELSKLIEDIHHALHGGGDPMPEPVAKLEWLLRLESQ